MVAKKNDGSDVLSGMKEICNFLGVSDKTALDWHKFRGMPIRKEGGIWVGSRKKIEAWNRERIEKNKAS